MRWRGSVRAMARLRTTMSADQLTTLRYEDMLRHPAATATAVSGFVGDTVGPIPVRAGRGGTPPGDPSRARWRACSRQRSSAEIESVAGPDLRRVGY